MKDKLLLVILPWMLGLLSGEVLQAMQQQPPATEALLSPAENEKLFLNISTKLIYNNIQGLQAALEQALTQGFNLNFPRLGITLLDMAIRLSNVDAVKMLLAAGADVNARNSSGSTPLMFAIAEKKPAIQKIPVIQALLATPTIDVTIKNEAGQTALDLVKADNNLTPEDKQKIINLIKFRMSLKERGLEYIRENRDKFTQEQINMLPLDLREQL